MRLGKDLTSLPSQMTFLPCAFRPILPLDLEDDFVHGDAGVAPQLVEADRLGGDGVAVLVEMERAHDPVDHLRVEQLARHRRARTVRALDGLEHDLRTLSLVDGVRGRELTR